MTVGVAALNCFFSYIKEVSSFDSVSVKKVGILWCILGMARLLCNPV